MATLAFLGVQKRFGSTTALAHLDLELAAGELVTLLGPSGGGKNTALRLAAGFEIPDTGSVVVDGIDMSRTPPNKRNMGMVFQSYSLFPNLNAAGNVAFGLRTGGAGGGGGGRQGRGEGGPGAGPPPPLPPPVPPPAVRGPAATGGAGPGARR